MGLSSTMRTLMGGTEPSRRPVGGAGWEGMPFLGLRFALVGRGEESRGGGVAIRCGTDWIGGVGRGGGVGAAVWWMLRFSICLALVVARCLACLR